MGRRTVLLIAAVVIAALGVALIFFYVAGVQNRANDNAQLVKILVAKGDISPGVTASQAQQDGMFEQKQIPAGLFPPGGVSTIDPIADQVALGPIYTGQQILAQMFGDPSQTSALAIPKGKLALSVQLQDPNRVAGFVVPGSNVAVFATVTTGKSNKTQLLLSNAAVIGVGPTTTTTTTTTQGSNNNQTTEQIPQTILTLALDQKQAQKIVFAQSEGDLYLGLLTDSSSVRPSGPTTNGNLFH